MLLGKKFQLKRYDTHAVFYALETNDLSLPKVMYCIRIDSDFHVNLFYAGAPIALPKWISQTKNARLTSRSMIENLPVYIQGEAEEHESIWEELSQLKLTKKHVYSANLTRYALMLRYSSLPAYKQPLTEFNLLSVSFLRKLTSGKINALSSTKLLKSSGKISEDVILMFDKIYPQKCEEYEGGETTGADFSGNLYKGLVCFMIVALKSNVPFVIMPLPEKEVSGEWVMTEILRSLMKLKESRKYAELYVIITPAM